MPLVPFTLLTLFLPRAGAKVGLLKVFCPSSAPAGVGDVGPKGGLLAALPGEGPEGGRRCTRPSSTGGPWGRGGPHQAAKIEGGGFLLAGATQPSSCVSLHAVPAHGAVAVGA